MKTSKLRRPWQGKDALAIFVAIAMLLVVATTANAQAIRAASIRKSISGKISSLFGGIKDTQGDTTPNLHVTRGLHVEPPNETFDNKVDQGELGGVRGLISSIFTSFDFSVCCDNSATSKPFCCHYFPCGYCGSKPSPKPEQKPAPQPIWKPDVGTAPRNLMTAPQPADSPPPEFCFRRTIDFSETANGRKLVGGEYVMFEWEDFGLVLSSYGGYGVRPRLFDTSNIGNQLYGDFDLGTPNERCSPPGPGIGEGGEPDMKGENCEFLGNVLIIQENNDDTSIPDDNVDGGIITFDFEKVAEHVYDIGLLDVDYKASITVIYQVTNGSMRTKTIRVPILGDNSYQVLPIDVSNVRQIKLTMVRSAAVTSISFCPPSTVAPVTPTPAPVTPTPAPVTPMQAPVTPTPAPSTPTPAPVTPTPAPVTATPAPVTEAPTTFIPTSAPVTPTPAPSTPTPAPVTPTPATVTPTSAPVTATSAPSTPTPATDNAGDRAGEEQCEDLPGWHDSDGPTYDCNFYAEGRNCQRFDSDYENFGYTAREACCACGGGNIGGGGVGGAGGENGVAPITPTPVPVTPTPAPFNPTQAPVTPTSAPVAPTLTPVTPAPSPVTTSDTAGEQQCEDFPEWYDSDGPLYDCSFYAKGDNCERFDSDYENFGYTANEACCACGGGNIGGGDGGGGGGGGGEENGVAPVTATQAPVTPPPAPVTPTSAPVTATPAPLTPTPAPVTPTLAPVTPTSAPVTATPAPLTPTPAPVTPTPAPVAPTPAPVTPTWAPITPTPSPVTPTPAPVTPTPAPLTPTPAPVTPTPAPVTPTSAPVTPTSAPVTPTPAPVTPTSAPVTPTPAPVTPTPAPVTPTPVPVTPTPAPVTPTPAPVTPTLAPVTPTSAPVIPTLAPVTPTPAPVTPTPAPVNPTQAPVTPTAAPVAPTPAPVTPTPAPVTPTAAPVTTSVRTGVYGLQPSCNSVDKSKYNTCLDLVSESGSYESWMEAFAKAVQRWESIIVGDLPSVSSSILDTSFACTGYPSTIDDVYICAQDGYIDGKGDANGRNVLGFANVYYSRGSGIVNSRTGLQYKVPLTGYMKFDSADIAAMQADSTFDEVIFHEMGHVLGLGSLWEVNGLYIQGSGEYASGTYADDEWKKIGCSGPLPVEIGISNGTADSHWDEDCLGSEIMTGYKERVTSEVVSRITIASLQDMGYEVDYSQADPFTIADLDVCGSFCPEAGRRLRQSERKLKAKLSSEDLDVVMHYAKAELTKLHEEFEIARSDRDRGDRDDGIIAAEEVHVLYKDAGGRVHEVPVTWDDVKDREI